LGLVEATSRELVVLSMGVAKLSDMAAILDIPHGDKAIV